MIVSGPVSHLYAAIPFSILWHLTAAAGAVDVTATVATSSAAVTASSAVTAGSAVIYAIS
jgi:hypothetical protein